MRDPSHSEAFWTTGEVARALGISTGRVWELTKAGSIPCLRTANGNLYRLDDVREAAEKRRRESTENWRVTPPPTGDASGGRR